MISKDDIWFTRYAWADKSPGFRPAMNQMLIQQIIEEAGGFRPHVLTKIAMFIYATPK